MEKSYNAQEREEYWTQKWVEDKLYQTPDNIENPEDNEYVLDMFPYPSGSGLHVGHPMGYVGSDIYTRLRRMQGKNVLHPMGYDAFGLPAEQFAIETNNHPRNVINAAVTSFRGVMQRLGLSYDWDREVNTADPDYYKWTQWIFAKLYEQGLAEYKDVDVTWCPALGTVVANDEIEEDGTSKRGGFPTERTKTKQWVLKITDYAQRLLDDLEELDWPEHIKEAQRQHIGRSEGLDLLSTLKCITVDFRLKHLFRSTVLKGSTRTIVDECDDKRKVCFRDGSEIRSLWEELPQEPVRVFIQSSLP